MQKTATVPAESQTTATPAVECTIALRRAQGLSELLQDARKNERARRQIERLARARAPRGGD